MKRGGMLHLKTFGGLSVDIDGIPAKGAAQRRKTLALLALLAGAGHRGVSRDKLIASLWPETDAKHGRDLLKQACYALRRDLHNQQLFLGSIELRLNPAVISSDCMQFQVALEEQELERAVALYEGPFLDGFHESGTPEFDEWADGQRERLAACVRDALEKLATAAAARADHQAAAEWWRRLAVLDPLSARAARGHMTALASQGEVSEALRHGRAYEALVHTELGGAPEPAVAALLERLRLEPTAGEGVTAQELHLVTRSGSGRRTVGYDREREMLRAALGTTLRGRGLVVGIAGEPGSGKTTLVEDFLGEIVASGRPCHLARGSCSERLAGSGAYLPLLDALENLLRSDARGLLAQLMRQLAPSWHAQVAPNGRGGHGASTAPGEVQAASQERLMRELYGFLHEASRLRPVVLFLDDVHWADRSTADVLSYAATRMSAAQILILVTYRPSDLVLSTHPFRTLVLDWQGRGICRELKLELLQPAEVEQLVGLEYPNHRFPSDFAAFLHRKTEGNPLFLVDLLRYLQTRRVIAAANSHWELAGSLPDLARELPESVRSMIERKIDQLEEDDRELLTVAGVQGFEFDAPVVARVLQCGTSQVESRLEALARRYELVYRLREGELPDRTPTVRYRFTHVLYQNALHAQLTATRRQTLSLAMAEALLVRYGDQASEIAAELALLFEAAREPARAVEYFSIAADRSARLFGHREAILLARRGLAQLPALQDTPERAGRELGLQLTLGFSLQVTEGYGSEDAARSMRRARELCQALGEIPPLFPALYGLWGFCLVSGDMRGAHEYAQQLVRLAQEVGDPIMACGAHTFMGASLHHLADLPGSLAHFDRALALYDPGQHSAYRALYRQEIGPYIRCESLRVLWLMGYPERARRRSEEGIALASEVADPQAAAFPLLFAALLHQHRREPEAAQQCAEACIRHCTEHGIAAQAQWASIVRGWALAEQGLRSEGIAQMRESLMAHRAMRLQIVFPYFLSLLVEALAKDGQLKESLALITEALHVVDETDQHFYEAELYRLRGEVLLQAGRGTDDAEACFRHSLEIASSQQAKSLELRTAMSLARLWRREGRSDEGRSLLAAVYAWFTEGFDTPDLVDAAALLAADRYHSLSIEI